MIAGQFEQRLKVAKTPDKWFRYIKRGAVWGDGAGGVDGASCEGLERHDTAFRLCLLEPLKGLAGKYHDLIFVLFSKKDKSGNSV